jgi:hypothetical protein
MLGPRCQLCDLGTASAATSTTPWKSHSARTSSAEKTPRCHALRGKDPPDHLRELPRRSAAQCRRSVTSHQAAPKASHTEPRSTWRPSEPHGSKRSPDFLTRPRGAHRFDRDIPRREPTRVHPEQQSGRVEARASTRSSAPTMHRSLRRGRTQGSREDANGDRSRGAPVHRVSYDEKVTSSFVTSRAAVDHPDRRIRSRGYRTTQLARPATTMSGNPCRSVTQSPIARGSATISCSMQTAALASPVVCSEGAALSRMRKQSCWPSSLTRTA